jgi:hypothetical protein
MSLFRGIPIHVHAALEIVAAPLLLVAPFALGFSYLAGTISIALGILLTGLALSVNGGQGERGSLPLQAHASLDYIMAAITIAAGILVGIATADVVATIFLVGFGSAHLALTASTRFSRPLGA